MINRIADISLRQAALVAGVGYLIVFILGFFANDFALANIIREGDASTAANNIRASEFLFRKITGIWLFLMTVDVVIAWALYVFSSRLAKISHCLQRGSGWCLWQFLQVASKT